MNDNKLLRRTWWSTRRRCGGRSSACRRSATSTSSPSCSTSPQRRAAGPPRDTSSSTSFGWGNGGNVTSAGWQVILCDPIWHVSSRSGEACCELLYSVYFFLPCRQRRAPAPRSDQLRGDHPRRRATTSPRSTAHRPRPPEPPILRRRRRRPCLIRLQSSTAKVHYSEGPL